MPSSLEAAVELRLGEKRTGQAQNLIGFAQFAGFTFQGFDPVPLGGAQTLMLIGIASC